jgi:hypothetical protein
MRKARKGKSPTVAGMKKAEKAQDARAKAREATQDAAFKKRLRAAEKGK